MKNEPGVSTQPPALDCVDYDHIKTMPSSFVNHPETQISYETVTNSGYFVIIPSTKIDFVLERFNTRIGASAYVDQLHPYHNLPISITARPRRLEPIYEIEDLCIGFTKV